MKNQNDMIISVVAIVLGLIGFCIGFFTKRQVVSPPAPTQVVVTPPQLQGAEVKLSNSLPSAGSGQANPFGASGGGGGAAGGGRPGAPSAAGTSAGGPSGPPRAPTAAGTSAG